VSQLVQHLTADRMLYQPARGTRASGSGRSPESGGSGKPPTYNTCSPKLHGGLRESSGLRNYRPSWGLCPCRDRWPLSA